MTAFDQVHVDTGLVLSRSQFRYFNQGVVQPDKSSSSYPH